jgi:hypothetical protein
MLRATVAGAIALRLADTVERCSFPLNGVALDEHVVQDADCEAVRVFLERAVRLADSPSPRARNGREAASDTRAGGTHRHGRRGSTVALHVHSGRERA